MVQRDQHARRHLFCNALVHAPFNGDHQMKETGRQRFLWYKRSCMHAYAMVVLAVQVRGLLVPIPTNTIGAKEMQCLPGTQQRRQELMDSTCKIADTRLRRYVLRYVLLLLLGCNNSEVESADAVSIHSRALRSTK
jgi:hypothetical protein